MATRGRLTDDQMDMLEQWIGKGPKTFTLLYTITHDKCDPAVFHQKCDNQGPTVTVLYNQYGSVYGGYASVSWNINDRWLINHDNFLFQLIYNGSFRAKKFVQRDGTFSMYCGPNYGPYFKNGDGLRTFMGTVNDAGGYFPLNGNMKGFKAVFDTQGTTSDQVNNGTMNVTELEVYKVSDGQRQKSTKDAAEILPWRKTKNWNDQFLDELTEEIVSFKPQEDLEVTEVRILMIGPVGAGKSSFINTINSVFRGRITNRARSGCAEQSLTTTFTPYKTKVRSGDQLKFRFCDTRGLEETSELADGEYVYILDGNIPNYYQFGSTSLSFKTPGFKLDPTPKDQIHCAVFILDSTTLDVLPAKVIGKMKSVQKLIDQRGIPQLIVLTKIDKLCTEVEKNISLTFKSKQVEQHVEKASQLLGLPESNVLPVKNYNKEVELDENISILALLALRQILHFTEDYLDNLSDRNTDLKEDMEKLKLEK